MLGRNHLLGPGFLALLLLGLLFSGAAATEGISPAQEQEFLEAKAALEGAQRAQAERYAPEPFSQAQEFLAMADHSRNKDAVRFTQASRLARAYAELSKSYAELKLEEERLMAVKEELAKAKAEIDRLKKSP